MGAFLSISKNISTITLKMVGNNMQMQAWEQDVGLIQIVKHYTH